MKRFLLWLPLFLFCALPAAGAADYFEDTSLVLVVYNESDNELGVDLGDVDVIDFSAQETELMPAGTVSLDPFGPAITSWSQLNAGAFVATDDWKHGYFAIPTKSDPGVVAAQVSNFRSSSSNIRNLNYKNYSSGGRIAVNTADFANSYDRRMNRDSTSPGSYAAYRHGTGSESNLTNVGNPEIGYVDMYLFHYTDMINLDKGPDAATDYIAVLRINADGSVVLNPPVVNHSPSISGATATPDPADEGTTVTLSGSATDSDEDPLTYEWTTTGDIEGFPKTGSSVTFPAPMVESDRDYSFTLTVSDGELSDTATVTVTVKNDPGGGTNHAPTISSATASPNPATEGVSVTLEGEASDSDEGDTLTYTWSTSDGISGFPLTGDEVSFIAPNYVDGGQNTYTITLTVSDGTDTTTQDVSLAVTEEDTGPNANAGPDQSVEAGASVTLDGSGSSGEGLTFAWQQTGGPAVENFANTENAVATFTVPGDAEPGKLVFSLTVTNAEDETDTDACNVFIVDSGYNPPEAHAGEDQSVWEKQTVRLDGSNSYPNASTVYFWTQLSGPTDVTIQNADTPNASFAAPDITEASAVFVFQLMLTDTVTEYESVDTVTITVQKNLPPTAPSSALTPVDTEGIWEADTPNPSFAVNNAEDPDGDALTYDFEIYDTPSAEPEHFVIGANKVPEGDTITTWTAPTLAENTLYYFRARAGHTLHEKQFLRQVGPWMDLVPFFINEMEEFPGVPTIPDDAEGKIVGSKPVLIVGNTADPDRDPLTYEFAIYLDDGDPVYSPHQLKTEVLEGTEGTTQWTVETALQEDTTYWWRARAVDDTERAGDWTEAVSFFVTTGNDKPTPPVMVYPGNESEIGTVDPIFEIDAGTDPEGDGVTHIVELDTVKDFSGENRIQADSLEAIAGVVNWEAPVSLDDNTTYFYRVKASDGELESNWNTGSFFVNLENDPPNPLVNTSPADTNPETTPQVSTLTPKLVVRQAGEDAIPDPDLDRVTYLFEVFLASDMAVAVCDGSSENPEWIVDTALTNGKKYTWHARAVDEHGEPGDWSPYTSFITGANHYQPSIPERVSPFNSGTVNTRSPVLSVVAAADGDGNDVWVEFELYRDAVLSDFVSFGLVPAGATATSWQVDTLLDDLATYFWRARSTDGEKYSAWTTVSTFQVNLSGVATPSIRVWKVDNYDPLVPWYTVVEVDNPESPVYGTRLVVPPGALSYNETIYIGEATSVPSMSEEMMPLGKVIDFGPSGTVFNVPVTIKIPYTNEDLEKAGGITPQELKVYTYDEASQQWESIPIDEVDEMAKLLICEVDHFSLYLPAAGDVGTVSPSGENEPSASDGGGGGGGCFIGAAGAPMAGAGLRWLIAAALTMSLVVRKR